MKRLVDLVKLDRLDSLIRRQATGNATHLAKRLSMSRSSLFELIAFLREEMHAPILYSKSRHSYIYEYVPKFYLGFERERLSPAGLQETYGKETGDGKTYPNDDDSDDTILDDDINFNDLYID